MDRLIIKDAIFPRDTMQVVDKINGTCYICNIDADLCVLENGLTTVLTVDTAKQLHRWLGDWIAENQRR